MRCFKWQKTIVAYMLICKGSESDTQEFMESVYHISIGKISRVINEASEKEMLLGNSYTEIRKKWNKMLKQITATLAALF